MNDKPIEFEKVSIDEARKAFESPRRPYAEFVPAEFAGLSFEAASQAVKNQTREESEKGWHAKRAAQHDEPLQDATVQWVLGLPQEVRPVALGREYPRILNRLCELWKRPSRCDPLLQELMIDNRGGRKGFPPAIAKEIAALVNYYQTVYPYRHTSWDKIGYKT